MARPSPGLEALFAPMAAGSTHLGAYATYPDTEMIACREKEQQRAADLGQYSFVVPPSSATLKDPNLRPNLHLPNSKIAS